MAASMSKAKYENTFLVFIHKLMSLQMLPGSPTRRRTRASCAMHFKWTSKWQTLLLRGTPTVNVGASVAGQSKLCMWEVVSRYQVPGCPSCVQKWWSLAIKIMRQADLGLNPTQAFSVCIGQFTSVNRNKHNTYVLVRVQSKTQKPLCIFQ